MLLGCLGCIFGCSEKIAYRNKAKMYLYEADDLNLYTDTQKMRVDDVKVL